MSNVKRCLACGELQKDDFIGLCNLYCADVWSTYTEKQGMLKHYGEDFKKTEVYKFFNEKIEEGLMLSDEYKKGVNK